MDDDLTLKFRGRSVDLAAGDKFELPFESPLGGCVVRYTFMVHDGLQLHFSVLDEAGTPLCTLQSASAEGETAVPTGMHRIVWDNTHLLAFSGFVRPRAFTYEIIVMPCERLALRARQRLIGLVLHGAIDDVRAGLEPGGALHSSVLEADELGRTLLHAAAARGSVEVIDELLHLGAPLEACTTQERTPFLEACARACVGGMASLLRAGASVAAVDARRQNAMHLLCNCSSPVGAGDDGGHEQGLRMLLRAPGLPAPHLEATDLAGDTPLMCAARSGLLLCCRMLLSAVRRDRDRDEAALYAAATHGRLRCATLLVECGARPVCDNGEERSALHGAAGAGHIEVLRFLLDECAALDGGVGTALLRTDGMWRSPLLCACAAGQGEVVEFLVDSMHAPLEQRDAAGNTPLLAACSAGDPKAVAVLLRAGADPRRRNRSGRDALCCAAVGGHVPVLPLLLPACGDRLPDALVQAAGEGEARTALALVELCPLPLPMMKSPGACAQLVDAFWRRTSEELGVAQRSYDVGQNYIPPSKAAGPVREAAAIAVAALGADKVANAAGGAAAAAAAVAGASPAGRALSHALGAIDGSKVTAPEDQRAVGARLDFGEPGHAAAEEQSPASALALDDLTNIQELIRLELMNGDDDDDQGDDDDGNGADAAYEPSPDRW